MQQRYSINKNKYLLDYEHQKLMDLLKTYQNSDVRNCLILEIALKTGARAQEILNLRVTDLNPHDQSLFIKGLKGSNDRELPLPQPLFNRLSNFAKKESDEKIFNISYNRLRQIWEFYRPVPKKFHCLRHTFAIRLYKRTKDIRLLQMALGHRNITNTMVYADYVYSVSEMRKLIEY